MKSTDSVIVSWDFSHGKDVGVLIVGKQEKGKVIKPDGERVEINRYFKEGEKDFVEIDVAEYEIRQKMHEERLEKMKKDCNGCFGAANNDCLRCEEELQYESE